MEIVAIDNAKVWQLIGVSPDGREFIIAVKKAVMQGKPWLIHEIRSYDPVNRQWIALGEIPVPLKSIWTYSKALTANGTAIGVVVINSRSSVTFYQIQTTIDYAKANPMTIYQNMNANGNLPE